MASPPKKTPETSSVTKPSTSTMQLPPPIVTEMGSVRGAGIVLYRLTANMHIEYLMLQTTFGKHHWMPPKGNESNNVLKNYLLQVTSTWVRAIAWRLSARRWRRLVCHLTTTPSTNGAARASCSIRPTITHCTSRCPRPLSTMWHACTIRTVRCVIRLIR